MSGPVYVRKYWNNTIFDALGAPDLQRQESAAKLPRYRFGFPGRCVSQPLLAVSVTKRSRQAGNSYGETLLNTESWGCFESVSFLEIRGQFICRFYWKNASKTRLRSGQLITIFPRGISYSNIAGEREGEADDATLAHGRLSRTRRRFVQHHPSTLAKQD